jgi:hypothetical protein
MCRIENQIFKVSDYCISFQAESIKREIFKNGPVIGQLVPYTDLLAYKGGSYHKTQESFKFNGQHIVKIVGWAQSIEGGDEWIIENTWGETWGEAGYGKVIGGRGDTQIDFYAIGPSVVPYSVYDYYSMQNMANAANEETSGMQQEDDLDLDQYADDEEQTQGDDL